jgi:L-lactate dehydrogenase (cytochrome)
MSPTNMTFTNVEDFRELARRRIPRAIFEYGDGGSYNEVTLRANTTDLEDLRFRQRVMVDVSNRSLKTRIVGIEAEMPLVIAPTGLGGLFYADGEIHGALAAEKAGIPFCLSTVSICSIEDVRSAVKTPFWFQLYVMRDRGFTKSLIERAVEAKCSALVLTVDLQVGGQRHRDIKNGLSIPPRLTLRNALDIMTKPEWAIRVLMGRRRTFGNLQNVPAGQGGMSSLSKWIAEQFDPSLTWKDIEWVRSIWPGKLVIKGLLDEQDARQAVACGLDAIVVSNHGGRQLDSTSSSISALPGIVDAVGGATEILFDGGIRSGHDILKALALGASASMIGRAYLYALASGGLPRVAAMLEILRNELDTTMALTGVRDVTSVNASILLNRFHSGRLIDDIKPDVCSEEA